MATPDPDLERLLWEAVEGRSLELHYQPVVGLHDATLAAAEALLRWRHPSGLVPAGAFLPQVRDRALVHAISDFAFDTAARQAATWRQRFPDWLFPVTVNVGVVDFTDTLVERVGELRERYALASGALGVDVAEPLLLGDVLPAAARVAALKEAGAQIFVDDFGGTHAPHGIGAAPAERSTEELLRSLVALEQCRIDVVKVDRAVVARCFAGEHQTGVVQSLVRVAHLSGFRILAEGVETGHEAEVLRRVGFDLAQGYFFQRPHGPGHIDRLLLDLADARQAFAAQRTP